VIEADRYLERVYAGILGKIIGVYLGRPIEGWTHERITAQWGEVDYYLNARLNRPLVVPDDDISGTLVFLRALPDYGNSPQLTPAQVGQTWLNYLVENQTVLWWGGLGNSTEHTAYLRLKNGLAAPASGSMALNGQVVAEQIGAQIFVDGWAMVAPGDPERAADLARRAASVSHDGEAIFGAQVIAAMEALAFVESDLSRLLDVAVALIPRDSLIYRLIQDLRDWQAGEPDWRRARQRLEEHYGYDKYGGNCHMIPNHGVVQLALLYGQDNFQTSLMIANTSGWDTDCNSGNVGCLLGIKNGLAGIDAGPDWRSPVADRLYLPSADGGGAITDAAREAYRVVNIGRGLAGQPALAPKGGARYHFEAPGAVQGFCAEVPAAIGTEALSIRNVIGHSLAGERSLALEFRGLTAGRALQAATATFVPAADPAQANLGGYGLKACPTLYPGQTVRARLSASAGNLGTVACQLYLEVYNAEDQLARIDGPRAELAPGDDFVAEWPVPDTGCAPIAKVGVALGPTQAQSGAADGVVFLDYLTWDGAPHVVFTRPPGTGQAWRHAWVDAVSKFGTYAEPMRIIQNDGIGLLIQGTREWTNYTVTADITAHMAAAAGLAARVQGLRRYYALVLVKGGKLRLIKSLDGERVLAETDFPWQFRETHQLQLDLADNRIAASIDGKQVFDLVDVDRPLLDGAVGLVIEAGCTATHRVVVHP
jgi:ADP-ribosylglycohydrolase